MMTRAMVAAALGAVVLAATASANAQQRVNRPANPRGNADEAADAATPLLPRKPKPAFAIEGGLGAAGFLAGAAEVGPAWNVRLTANMTNRWALEGNYLGSINNRTDDPLDRTLMMTAFDAGVRYNILRGDQAPLQPFAVAALGYAGYFGEKGDLFTLTIPLTVGAERLLTRNTKIGARFSFRPALFDHLGVRDVAPDEEAGGDTWSLLGHFGGAF